MEPVDDSGVGYLMMDGDGGNGGCLVWGNNSGCCVILRYYVGYLIYFDGDGGSGDDSTGNEVEVRLIQ
jgi:hypothetical protein